MKKPLQFVALILVALLFAQPLLAAAQCTPACAGKSALQCCNQLGGMSMPGMANMPSSDPSTTLQMACADTPCCLALHAAILPVPPPQATVVISTSPSQPDPPPATFLIRVTAPQVLAPPGPRTAKYILFHNFRT